MTVALVVATLLVLAAALGSVGVVAGLARRHPELRWDWDAIDAAAVVFPPGFVWGTATAAHQVEGGCDRNNWSRWEQGVDGNGAPRIRGGQRAGAACEHWRRFRDDVALMQALGVAAYRFSIEWSKLEPAPGRVDPAAVAHYHEVLDALAAAGIRPMVTLHHFTHPLWFADLGGFERGANIDHFVAFCERMFREYGARVDLWCTINEPAVYTTMGYMLGTFPPGARDPALAARVLRNLLVAHVRVYRALKALPGGDRVAIGLVKNVVQFDPARRWHPLDWAICRLLDGAYNRSVLACLERGVFRMFLPGRVWVREAVPEAAGATDFVGLNYYSHAHMRARPSLRHPFVRVIRPGDVATDMPYAMYPEGFYRALKAVARLGKPIYVTENGIADARDDRRATFIRRYLYALARAIRDGADVRGYYYWSLMDNFEWTEGFRMCFGLYAVDFATQARRLRAGAQAFRDVVRSHRG
jgi:beta-glucosidase